MSDDLCAHDAELPRYLGLAPRSAADTEGEVQRVLGKLEDRGQALTISRLLANATTAFRPFSLLSAALLYRASLPAETRELVILHLAARLEVSYEWTEHLRFAAEVGVPDAQIAAIADGDIDAEVLSARDRAALRLADELIEARAVHPDTLAAVRDHLDEQQLLELVLSTAFWGGFIPLVIGALGLEGGDVR